MEKMHRAALKLLKSKLSMVELPPAAAKDIQNKLQTLDLLPIHSNEYFTLHAFLEFVAELPWGRECPSDFDIHELKNILDRNHAGRKDIKERLLEHFSLMSADPHARVPPFCFVGPQGVGKKSFARSIAKALNRPSEVINLSIVDGDQDLRGQRRSFLGSQPGKILQAIKRSGVKNPVLILEQIDKINIEESNPAAGLLELLDPSLNRGFVDSYLNYPFDLSDVFVISTATRVDTIPDPIYDQLDVFAFSGYTEQEKIQIARNHIIPKHLRNAGVLPEDFSISDAALLELIRDYTREAGVRRLNRYIARLANRAVKERILNGAKQSKIEPSDVKTIFYKYRYHREPRREVLNPGVAAGLAWTEAGGEILYIESVKLPSSRQLILTGHLGKVMRESAETALSWVTSKAARFRLDSDKVADCAVHIHVPAGAIPKDGPSAGVAMVAAISSLFTETSVDSSFAMTGEITLGGNVLPVGGIKEKLLAAHRDNFLKVILPKDNEKDLEDIPLVIRNEMQFFLVNTVEDALDLVLPQVNHSAMELAPAENIVDGRSSQDPNATSPREKIEEQKEENNLSLPM